MTKTRTSLIDNPPETTTRKVESCTSKTTKKWPFVSTQIIWQRQISSQNVYCLCCWGHQEGSFSRCFRQPIKGLASQYWVFPYNFALHQGYLRGFAHMHDHFVSESWHSHQMYQNLHIYKQSFEFTLCFGWTWLIPSTRIGICPTQTRNSGPHHQRSTDLKAL